MRATEEHDRFLDALEHTELRAHVVRLVQPFIGTATSPYELLWRYMNGLRPSRHQPLAVRVA